MTKILKAICTGIAFSFSTLAWAAPLSVEKIIDSKYVDELKEKAINEIEAIKNSEINKITDYTLKTAIEKFVDDQIDKIEAIDSFEEISTTVDEIIEDTKEFIASLITNN